MGVKGTLLGKVHSDGRVSVLHRGIAVPASSAVAQCQLVHLGWPVAWWVRYPRDRVKPGVLSEVDLENHRVLAHYKVPPANVLITFFGGFIAVTARGQNDNWLEVYRTRGGKAVLVHKAKADFYTMLEWRPHGRLVYNGNRKEGLYQLDVHTGVIKPTFMQLKKWIVPPNPNSPEVIIHSKAWHRAVGALLRGTSKLRGPYKKKFFHDFLKRGRPGADPWKWMKVNMDEISKLYAEQEAAAGKK